MSTSESVCWHIQADKYKEATGFPFSLNRNGDCLLRYANKGRVKVIIKN